MTDSLHSSPAGVAGKAAPAIDRLGLALVAGSAMVWSFGGAIARFIDAPDPWTTVFWRSLFAAAFLLAFLLWRDGGAGAVRLLRAMGWPGIGVALCFATASSSFVMALQHTTVANILLFQATVPMIAALFAWALFGERVRVATWIAIAVVFAGVAIMVSDTFTGKVSPVGDGLALLIAMAFASATLITRRYAHVRMVPAVFTGTSLAAVFAFLMAGTLSVSGADMGFLFLFGAGNLGLGLAMFVTGARLVPSALAALVGTLEVVFGPVWVWLIHAETPSAPTLVGGALIVGALVTNTLLQLRRQAR